MTNKEVVNGLERAIGALDAYFHEHNITIDEQYANVDYRLVRAAAEAYADIVREVLMKDKEEKKLNESGKGE